MASIVQSIHAEAASGSTSQTVTLPQALRAGSTVVVLAGFGRNGNPNIDSVVNNGTGNTYTAILNARGENLTANPKMCTDIFYCDNVNGGATTITATWNGTAATRTFVGVIEFLNSITPSADSAGNSVGTTTPATGGSVVADLSDTLLLSCIITATGTVSSVASPWTSLAGSGSYMTATYNAPPPGTYAPTYTLSGNVRWASSTAEMHLTSADQGGSNMLLTRVN